MGYIVDGHFEELQIRATESEHDKLNKGYYRETYDDALVLAFELRCESIAYSIARLERAIQYLDTAICAMDAVYSYDTCDCPRSAWREHSCGLGVHRAAYADRRRVRIYELDAAKKSLAYFMPSGTLGDEWDWSEQCGHAGSTRIVKKLWKHNGSVYAAYADGTLEITHA